MPARRTTRTLPPPAFRNVDLEIESATPLDAIVAEWGENVVVLYSGPGRLGPGPALKSRRHLLTLETAPEYKDPDRAIHAFCALVEGLSRATAPSGTPRKSVSTSATNCGPRSSGSTSPCGLTRWRV